jgi:hypothetical protein
MSAPITRDEASWLFQAFPVAALAVVERCSNFTCIFNLVGL